MRTGKETTFIGIAGGSGSGKTSLAERLRDALPDAAIISLDDFQKYNSTPNTLHGFPNWEEPSYIDWEGLIDVLQKIKRGEVATIQHRDQATLTEVAEQELSPREVTIIEGYLLFYNSVVRSLLDVLIYLDADDDTRMVRRTKAKPADYVEHVLLPMHHRYVEPTKQWATRVVDTTENTLEACAELILKQCMGW